jgi:uncharacterized membrane protein
MSTASSARYGGWFQAWCGLVVGVCLILPALLRLEREGWTGFNIFFVVVGTLLVIFWVTRMVVLSRAKRQGAPAETEEQGKH